MDECKDALKITIPEPTDAMPKVDGLWHITAPWLKLGLKYGFVEGSPWSPTSTNRSVAFDRYALSRGPGHGPPNLTDLSVTLLMNSGVSGWDLRTLADHFHVFENDLKKLSKTLAKKDGLLELSPKELEQVGDVVDRICSPSEPTKLRRFGRAKTTKWLSLWAPSHVPMLDSVLEEALGGNRNTETICLLNPFYEILDLNQKTLIRLGEALGEKLGFPSPISPVRVLDDLIWFDWAGGYKRDEDDEEFAFLDWIDLHSEDEAICHEITDRSRAWLARNDIAPR